MSKAELVDLNFNGPSFTWHGSRNDDLVEERLDRGLTNQLWQIVWPNTIVTHGTILGSNHCPIIIRCGTWRKTCHKLFRFEAFWA